MIKDYFQNSIDREIETVIKADDRNHISDEVVEFIVTDELKKHLAPLFSTYNSINDTVNGVWISGHFGNGKSHVLKILSYVLENKEHDGWYSGKIFAEKIENDEILKGDVLKAIKTPSESILFNIEQHAQASVDDTERPVVSIFYKVFYEHQGYYGHSPRIAEFERWLDKDGLLQEFKSEFNEVSQPKLKMEWDEARMELFDPDVEEIIFNTLTKIKGGNPEKYEDILDKIEKDYTQSIDKFADMVDAYIKTKPKGFKLNFFADEVGQFVGTDVQMMVSIQTIAETLAIKTKGHSWVMITSQADIQTVVDWQKQDEMDNFGRIQARFKIRIPLTATGADEVVEKRLLTKKEKPKQMLEAHYNKKGAHLKTLLSFSDVGVQFKGYRDEEDFANKFPMVPYQFGLFQQCRIGLSKHDAFQGAHAAVGSRSMLGVFQEVIKSIADKDQNTLVSFDKMYEGTKGELRGTIQSNIELAEKNIDNKMAIRVLKTLFLIKYFDQFKATKRNISVLLIDDQNIDLKKHEEEIDRALSILENQSYIQRSGEFYEYLTDKEKDIDVGIKNTEIDEQAINTFLKEIFFDEIVRDNKITYQDNKTAYEFSPIVNGTPYGREKELKIEVITSDHIDKEETVLSHSMGTTILKLFVDPTSTFSKDIRLYKQTEKYLKQKTNTTTDPETLRTLHKVGTGNTTRKQSLITMANQILAKAPGFANGNRIDTNGTTDGRARVINTFQTLVRTVYSNLMMLKNVNFTEDIIRQTVQGPGIILFEEQGISLSEPENEILTVINLRKSQNERTSLNDLKNILNSKPYGWNNNAIFTLIARLYKSGGVELTQNSNAVEPGQLMDILLNSSHHANTLITPQAVFDRAKVNKLKKVYQEAFDETCTQNEAKDVALAFKEKLKEMNIEVEKLLIQTSNYPFLESLYSMSRLLSGLVQKEYAHFIENASEFEDDLLYDKEDLLSPIRSFMNGNQKKIYDDIRFLLERDSGNLNYADSEKLIVLRNVLEDVKPFRGNKIRDAKSTMDEVKQSVLQRIDEEKDKIREQIEQAANTIQNRNDFKKLEEKDKEEVLGIINEVSNKLENERFIANILQLKSELSDKEVAALNRIQEILTVKQEENGVAAEPRIKYIPSSDIYIHFEKSELSSEDDVQKYIEVLKEEYLKRIQKNLRIRL